MMQTIKLDLFSPIFLVMEKKRKRCYYVNLQYMQTFLIFCHSFIIHVYYHNIRNTYAFTNISINTSAVLFFQNYLIGLCIFKRIKFLYLLSNHFLICFCSKCFFDFRIMHTIPFPTSFQCYFADRPLLHL